MKRKIVAALCAVSLLTGCSAFDKDTEALTNELFGGNDTSEGTEVSSDVDSNNSEDSSADYETDTVTEDVTQAPVEEDVEQTPLETYSVGETSNVGFNSVICNLTVDSILRDEDAITVVSLYNSLHEDDAIADTPSEGFEYCVVEYTLDLKNTEGISKVPANVPFRVKGNCETDGAIEVGGKRYTNFGYKYYNSGDTTVSSGEVITNKIIFVIPSECETFSIELGEKESQSVLYDLR